MKSTEETGVSAGPGRSSAGGVLRSRRGGGGLWAGLVVAVLAHGALGAYLWDRGCFDALRAPGPGARVQAPAPEAIGAPLTLPGSAGAQGPGGASRAERPPAPREGRPRERPTAAAVKLPESLMRYDSEPAPGVGSAPRAEAGGAGAATSRGGPTGSANAAPALFPSQAALSQLLKGGQSADGGAAPRPAAQPTTPELLRGVHLPALVGADVALDRCATPRCLTVYVAPWCPACRRAAPLIKEMLAVLRARPVEARVVVGSDRDGSLRAVAADYGPDTLVDEHGRLRVRSFPSFIVSDASGAVLRVQAGAPATRADLAGFLDMLGLSP